MNPQDYVARMLWADCIKVVGVNVLTGQYTVLKAQEGEPAEGGPRAETIFGCMRHMAERGTIHPDDAEACRALMDKDAFARLLEQPVRKKSIRLRRWVGSGYAWVTLEIMFPEAFSAAEPTALFCWRPADRVSSGVDDAMRMLAGYYRKMLRVDLTADTYDLIRLYSDEKGGACLRPASISGWFRAFAEAGNVMEADLDTYLSFTDLDSLRDSFRWGGGRPVSCRYRRRSGEGFRWVNMELLPSEEYTDEHQVVMLYIREVHDPDANELGYRREMELADRRNSLLGRLDRHSLEQLNGPYGGAGNGCRSDGRRWQSGAPGEQASGRNLPGQRLTDGWSRGGDAPEWGIPAGV